MADDFVTTGVAGASLIRDPSAWSTRDRRQDDLRHPSKRGRGQSNDPLQDQQESQPGARARGAAAAYARSAGSVAIDSSTSTLIAGDFGGAMRKSEAVMRQLAIRLMGMPPADADLMVADFPDWLIESVRGIMAESRRAARSAPPVALLIHDACLRMDRQRGEPSLDPGSVQFVDAIEFRANGVVFDVRGSHAVHAPEPGVLIDTGEHGARLTQRLIDHVRTEMPDFGSADETDGAIVLIRADRSHYDELTRTSDVLDIDLWIPFGA